MRYSQGEDLFSAARHRNWVTAANGDTLAITTPTITVVLNHNGTYTTAATAKIKIRNRSSACCCRS